MAVMWTSKLGGKYDKDMIQRLDPEHHEVLKKLRKERHNASCAECGEGNTCWASVSLGVFLCVRCSDVHRGVGTHISKVKGCSGTYLWGPDELARMRELGNARAEALYGGSSPDARPSPDATKEQRMELCRQKYELRRWSPKEPVLPAAAPPQARSRPSTGGCDAKAAPLAKPADLIDLDAFFGESLGSMKPAARSPAGQPPKDICFLLPQPAQSSPQAAPLQAWSRPSTGPPLAQPVDLTWLDAQAAPRAKPADLIDLDAFFGESLGSTTPAAGGGGGEGADAPLGDRLAGGRTGAVQTPVPFGSALQRDGSAKVWEDFGAW